MRLLAGASGYSFKEWKGDFYPEKIKPEEMLPFYSARLPTVEINNTFYRMPKVSMLENWAQVTPPEFRFAIKASRRITHISRLKESAADSVDFLYKALAALGDKRGPVLFQLPPNFKKDVPRLAAFFDAMPDRRRVAFEFRHASWFDDETFDLLRRQSVALCVSDTGEEPVAPLVATTDWGYLRLRREDFTDAQLEEWSQKILAQPWQHAFVFLKHEEEGKGPKLAAKLIELCGASAVRAGR